MKAFETFLHENADLWPQTPLWCFFWYFITITAIHLASPYVASDKFPRTELDQHAESFLQVKEAAPLWNEKKTNFITRFSEGLFKLRHQLEFEPCWPDDMNGIPNAQQNAERPTQKRKQKQRYMDSNLGGYKPNSLQLKAQEQLMGYPNAIWNDFSAHNIQEDPMLQVSSKFINDLEQIKTELVTVGQEMRNVRIELQKNRVIAMEGNSRPWAPTQKGEQKTVRFYNYSIKNGHAPKWCRKKMRDEEIQKIQNEISSKRNHAPYQKHGTNAVDRSAQYDQNVDRSPDSDDGNNPTNDRQPTEEETGQDESKETTPPERRSFSRNSGMNLNVAQVTSAGESDDELSDPLPLGYWSLWKTLSFFIISCFFVFFILLTVIWWYFSRRLSPIRLLIVASKPPTLCRDTRSSTRNIFAVLFGIIDVNIAVFGHYALATSRINKAKFSLHVKSKQPSIRAHNHEQLLKTFYPTFKILTETFSQVRIGSVQNLLVVILILITIQQKSSPASLWPLWSPKNWTTGKTKAGTIFWILWTLTLGHCTGCHWSISNPLSLAKWGQLFVTV